MKIYMLRDVENKKIYGIYETKEEACEMANFVCRDCAIQERDTRTQEHEWIGYISDCEYHEF